MREATPDARAAETELVTEAGGPPRAETLFRLDVEARCGAARAGTFATPHGTVHTPAFMVVGTRGAVPSLDSDQVRAAGTEMIVANSYHLWLRPGEEVIRQLGGLHAFMRWEGPLLSDSGGYQLYSLPDRRISADGVSFGHLEGSAHSMLTPERSVEVQNALGADVIMALDECTPYPADEASAAAGVERTVAWAERCAKAHGRPREQALFGIVQGSVYPHLRERCAAALRELDLPGYAIGGVSVGESRELALSVAERTAPLLPTDRPRYLMGVGRPEEVVAAIGYGIDLFDCALPTLWARTSTVFTAQGTIRLLDRSHRCDGSPIDAGCDCATCRRGHSRAYLHHLFASHEAAGRMLAAVHNVRFYQRLVQDARRAVIAGRFEEYAEQLQAARRRCAAPRTWLDARRLHPRHRTTPSDSG